AMKQRSGRIGVVTVNGVISQYGDELTTLFGGSATEDIFDSVQSLLANDNVEAVVMVINSPGGSSYGIEELSDYLFSNRAKLVAISSSLCASAAYWLGSSCSLFCTPGGDVGSIGVYSMHEDMSQALDDAGIKITIAKAGRYKTELSPY